ncbi:MAG: phosphoadenosine phosphosulfate reductase family protein [Anaerolineales bacterium]|nr:phosphoadenosine phosphosulfate reductase family protein [Anaerolineales bacterium]
MLLFKNEEFEVTVTDVTGVLEVIDGELKQTPEKHFGISEASYKLAIREKYPLWMKLEITKNRIIQYHDSLEGQIYVCFSGGLDSTVLVDIVRSIFPDAIVVFCDTGEEFPEIKSFIKTIRDVITVRPKMTYRQVIEKYGYPVISKKVAMGFDRYRSGDEVQKKLRLHGGENPTSGKPQARTIPLKFHYLVNADFEISDRCCDILKKSPLKRFQKKTGLNPIMGQRIGESEERKIQYLKHGCNAFDKDVPQSNPLSFWADEDIKEYITTNNLPYSEIYDKDGEKFAGEKRTGCMGCGFGIHLEERPNRFDRMKESHPKRYNLYMDKLNMAHVLKTLVHKTQIKLFQ